MNQAEFETYLDGQPKGKGTEVVGRFIENAFGMQERVVLPASYWRYVDWLSKREANDDFNLIAYFKDCDARRGEVCLSANLMQWLYFDMQERQEKNYAFPDFLNFI